MKYIVMLGMFFMYSHADVECSHFHTAKQAQGYYKKKLIGYKGLIPDNKGKVCAYLDDKFYVMKRHKGGYSDYSHRLLTKYDCEKLIQKRLKQDGNSGFEYSCFDKVTKPKTPRKNKASGIRR